MDEPIDPRATLDALCRDRGEDFAGLSRLLGRNPSYIQQFVRRGSPRRLDEADRAVLAGYFGIDQRLLGGPATAPPAMSPTLAVVPRLAVAASAGPGSVADLEDGSGGIAFDPRTLRILAGGDPAALSLIRVAGDSMLPTLKDGDTIMVDRADAADRLRPGIYVLRLDDVLVVKRVAPAAGRIAILSDNPAWPPIEVSDPAALTVIGRVVWSGGRIR